MKRFFLSALVFSSSMLFAQSGRAPLNFSSYRVNLGITTDESLTVLSRTGEFGILTKPSADWRRADLQSAHSISGLTTDQANFFNKDTGIVSGFISNGDLYNIVYRTTDAGNCWTAVKFGQSGWIDDAVNLENGEAWLSVSGSGIAYTADYGLSWDKLSFPNVKERFAKIYFNNKREGIIGSLWNTIAYTPDNCVTWSILHTPLGQGKYKKTNQSSRPEINQVAIYKDIFLVAQEDMVFWSKLDSINWNWLPNYRNFYTDATNTALFFQTNNGSFVKVKDDLTPVFQVKTGSDYFDAKCRNGNLFVVGGNGVVRVNGEAQKDLIAYSVKETEEVVPASIGYASTGTIGVANNKVYSQEEYDGEWKMLFTFPYDLTAGDVSVTAFNQLLYQSGDEMIYVDLKGKVKKSTSRKKMVDNFVNSGVYQLVFREGTSGCFHSEQATLTYTDDGSDFTGAIATGGVGKHSTTLPDNEDYISAEEVNLFVQRLPDIFNNKSSVTIGQLAFTPKEYEKCRKDILAFRDQLSSQDKNKKETAFSFGRNNLDFDKLLSLVDSVKTIGSDRLTAYLSGPGQFFSTTSYWKSIDLVSKNGDVLSISNRYFQDEGLHFPWTVSLNGLLFESTDFSINQFLDKVYPAFLKSKNRVSVLHNLVKKLYQHSTSEELQAILVQ